MKFSGRWTNDCQGKKDYDGPILEVSTRYWPRGGGFTEVVRGDRGAFFRYNEDRPNIKPSATSALVVREEGDCTYTLIEHEFEAETEEEVKQLVEAWVQQQMDIAVAALKAVFAENVA